METNSYSEAKHHQKPVNIRNIDLTVYLIGCMNNFNSREATESQTLVYDGEAGSYSCLASNS